MVFAAALAQPQLPWATPSTMSRCVREGGRAFKTFKTPGFNSSEETFAVPHVFLGDLSVYAKGRVFINPFRYQHSQHSGRQRAAQCRSGTLLDGRHGSHQRAGESLAVDEYSQDGGLMAWLAALSSSETL